MKYISGLAIASILVGAIAFAGGIAPTVVEEVPVVETKPVSSVNPLLILGLLVVIGVLVSRSDDGPPGMQPTPLPQ